MYPTYRFNGIAYFVRNGRLTGNLIISRVQGHLDVFYVLEFRMRLVGRIYEMLNLGHGKLSFQKI